MSDTKLNIITVYHLPSKQGIAKVNHAKYANTAVPRCVSHMQLNQYNAVVAEVFDITSGVLHAVIKRNVKGEIRIIFKREVVEGM